MTEKYCPSCGLDKQCCFHDKKIFKNEREALLRQCEARGSECSCWQSRIKLKQQYYQLILETIPPEILIKYPIDGDLHDIFNNFVLRHSNFSRT